MGPVLHDRLPGRDVSLPRGPLLLGRHLSGGGYLVPHGSGGWSIPSGTGSTRGQFRRTALPDDLTVGSVITIGDLVNRGEDASPLVPQRLGELEGTVLDAAIEKDLPNLAAVCWRPHDRLGVEYEVVPTARARRIPPAAIAHLAAHSEDWLARTRDGVDPARVLTRLFVAELDFYENRVAAKLIDHLRGYLADRVRRARSLVRLLEDRDRYRDELANRSSWRTLNRVAQLFAEWADVDGGHTRARQEFLQRLHDSLTALRGSTLYREVDRRVVLPVALRSTNLLNSDHRYHRVRRLWEAWGQDRMGTGTDESRTRRFVDAFDAYVRLLVTKACAYLRVEPASLTLQADRTLVLGDGPLVRIVPLAHALTADRSVTMVRQNIDDVTAGIAATTVPTIVVYPGLIDERISLPAELRARAHSTVPVSAVATDQLTLRSLIPVSPLEIDSIERLARGLRWALQGLPSLDNYPPTVALPGPLARELCAGIGNLAVTPDGLSVVAPPHAETRDRTHARLHQLAEDHSRLGRDVSDIHQLHAVIDNVSRELRELARCPLCALDRSWDFEARDKETFNCVCSCGCQWGLRICGVCEKRFPILVAGPAARSQSGRSTTRETVPTWLRPWQAATGTGDDIDRIFGNELLATPCTNWSTSPRFRCPRCQHCPAHGRSSCHGTAGTKHDKE